MSRFLVLNPTSFSDRTYKTSNGAKILVWEGGLKDKLKAKLI